MSQDHSAESPSWFGVFAMQSISERRHESFQRMSNEHKLEVVFQPVIDRFNAVAACIVQSFHIDHIIRLINIVYYSQFHPKRK